MSEIERIIDAGGIHPVFQPIVDLATGEPVALEALARGPHGRLHLPEPLFAAARDADRLGDLDRLCRSRAVQAALAGGLLGDRGRPSPPLFLNVEPATADAEVLLPDAQRVARRHGVCLVLELTERMLMAQPARLLAFAEHARAQGWGIAVDDVGVDPASLALMPLLRPEVVKLDVRLVARRPDGDTARIMTAVNAYAEESGATVLAEGIETAEQERCAVALGATLGQGFLFGAPSPTGATRAGVRPGSRELPLGAPSGERSISHSPFEAVAARRPTRRGTKDLLVEVTRLLEHRATQMQGLAVVLATFQEAPNFTESTARRYAELVARTALVVALGANMVTAVPDGLHRAHLRADDPVRGEWDVAVVGPHFAAALVARDLEVATGSDGDRPFDYVLTHDRGLVLDVARSLMNRAIDSVSDASVGSRAEGARPTSNSLRSTPGVTSISG